MTSIDHFNELHAASDDPWGYEGRWYERRKRAITVSSLPRERYRRAFEPGCSIGMLTEELAARCDKVVAVDAAPIAVELARRRTSHLSSVTVGQLCVPSEWPPGMFDLIVLSEIAYYLDVGALSRLLARCDESTASGAHIIAVHWLGTASDIALPGGALAAHRLIGRAPGWEYVVRHRDDAFLLDVLQRN